MELPHYHIYQVYTDPETGNETTKDVANAATLPLAESIIKLLEEKTVEIGDPNITFRCMFYDEHPSVTKHWNNLAEWSMSILDYPNQYPDDMDLGKEIRKSYNEMVRNAK